jgi:hypothetical protein
VLEEQVAMEGWGRGGGGGGYKIPAEQIKALFFTYLFLDVLQLLLQLLYVAVRGVAAAVVHEDSFGRARYLGRAATAAVVIIVVVVVGIVLLLLLLLLMLLLLLLVMLLLLMLLMLLLLLL